MSIYAGKKIYKGYEIFFWLTPRTIKANVWEPNNHILAKRFWVRDNHNAYVRLKNRITAYLDKK